MQGALPAESLAAQVAALLADPARAAKIEADKDLEAMVQQLREGLVDESAGTGKLAPTSRQLWLHAMRSGLPFIAFGFLDNSIMLLAGDAIECSFATALCLSTATCCALGNIVGDVCGIWSGGTVELLAERAGLPEAGLTYSQQKLHISHTVRTVGMVGGCVIGCVLGMFPIIWPKEWRLWGAPEKDDSTDP